jgi:hypothetical protein
MVQQIQLLLKKNLLREIGFLRSRNISPPRMEAPDDSPDNTSLLSSKPLRLNRRILRESLNSNAPTISGAPTENSRSRQPEMTMMSTSSSECSS